jgi:hypothetical protein
MTAIAARRPGPVTRNGLAPTRPYVWRAPRPAWMLAAIAAAEAQHGPPVPACVCGQRLAFRRGSHYATCPACGRRAYTGGEGPG